MGTSTVERPRVVSRTEWLEERQAHLAREKELTRASDELSRQRRELPWVKVEKAYLFDGARGQETLADLFDGRSQLIVKHFMLGPGWKEGCVGCSFGADHMDGALVHLEHHDVSYVAVSRAPLVEIDAYRQRMGWGFKWVSSFGSDFNYDYQVSFTEADVAAGAVSYNYGTRAYDSQEASGLSVFFKDAAGDVFHTYSCYARGDEKGLGTYMLLDLTPKGRNETGPRHDLTDWVRHHDRYDPGGIADTTGRYRPAPTSGSCCHGEDARS
jgi:predicted dithiol-disulfide oxidoreductase (DUF899 family)